MINEFLMIGIVLSILFYEITGISPGGLIVPAYIALYIDIPSRIILTIIIAFLTYIIVKVLSNYVILYGRRKFTIYILMSFLVVFFVKNINIYFFKEFGTYIFTVSVIGRIIPAILAQEIEKNGTIKTLSALLILSIFIKAISEIFYYVGEIR